jgi:NADH:ubiquinone reductase (H+-translocating)
MSEQENSHARVVIVGAGFGGLRAARALANDPLQVTLIDRNNYHLFQPLLYQVATSALSADQIAYPVRTVFRRQPNLTFHMGSVTGIDLEKRQVSNEDGILEYDYLVLAMGGVNNFFGNQSVAEHGMGLKDLDDAIRIRNHLLARFEIAAKERDVERRRALLTVVIVGGGPTGVECAGAISELIRMVLSRDFPTLDLNDVRILLLEGTDRLLLALPEKLGEFTTQVLRRKHVEVQFEAMVAGYDGQVVTLKDGSKIAAETLIWAAGVRASPLLDPLGLPQDRLGRVQVEPTLQVPGHPEVFVIGDAACLNGEDGKPLPMVAQVAMQQGRLAGRNIRNLLKNAPLETFNYKDLGTLATIGRNQAVARVAGLDFKGFLAWAVWVAVHIFWLIGFRNRVVTLMDWAWNYVNYDRAVRLIGPE